MHTYKDKVIPDEFYIGREMSDFMLISELGRGAHGVVFKVRSVKNGKIYALKKIKLEHLKQNLVKEALNEVRCLKKLKHENIIEYYSSFFAGEALYIVMEYAPGGDMHEVLLKNYAYFYQLIKRQKKMLKHFEEKDIWNFA